MRPDIHKQLLEEGFTLTHTIQCKNPGQPNYRSVYGKKVGSSLMQAWAWWSKQKLSLMMNNKQCDYSFDNYLKAP